MNYDYHTHTFFSDDSDTPMEEMVRAAIDKGIKDYAITDHYDPGYQDPEFPFILDFDGHWNALCHISSKYKEKITIAKGMEIGIMEGQFKPANDAINAHPYDFIIGSFHCYKQYDLYTIDFDKVRDKSEYTKNFYLYVHKCLDEFDNYDVIGHFTILDRYIGEVTDLTPCMDVIRETLKSIIQKEKGIELNTSNYRYGQDLWLPREEILKAYLDLGGEVLTLGSDSHEPSYQMHHFDDAVSFLKSIGFKYYCTFKERKPTYHKL